MKNRPSKKKNKIDPIIRLAEKNRNKSLDAVGFEKTKRNIETFYEQRGHDWRDESDRKIADMDADSLFKEMKRRSF